MSIAAITLKCDFAGCDESLYHAVSSLKAARRDQIEDEWISEGGRDFCPAHPPLGSPFAKPQQEHTHE